MALTLDLAELLAPMQQALVAKCSSPETRSMPRRIAFHPPCTLQHTQKIRGAVEGILGALGAELVPVHDAHLCCGSAGSYSLLQPELSQQLRARKLENLESGKPQMILSANIGCLSHLETGTEIPLRHWIEWVDGLLVR
jgi:glycolate oxidase iron-sulfur subunit